MPAHSSATVFAPKRSCTLVDELNREWSHLRNSSEAVQAADRWSRCEPVFVDVRSIEEVMAAAGKHGENDSALGALLRQAQAGDTFAGRTLLQVMLGAAIRLAVRTVHLADQDLDEAVARAISALWAVISTYPVAQRTKHANNISLDVLAALTRRGAAHRELSQTSSWEAIANDRASRSGGLPTPGDSPVQDALLTSACLRDPAAVDGLPTHPPLLDEPGARRPRERRVDFWEAAAINAHQRADDEQLILLLAWANRLAIISKRDARLLMALHSPLDDASPLTAAEVGQHLGLSATAVRQRASRAIRQLRTAVQAYAASPIVDTELGRISASLPVARKSHAHLAAA
jgi:hypothetical protein